MTGVEFEEPVKSMETKKPSMLEFMGLAGQGQVEGFTGSYLDTYRRDYGNTL